MTRHHLVVVGASLAGLRAVEAARHIGYDGPITLLGAEPHLPYDRPPLSKDFLHLATGTPEPTFHRSEEHLRRTLNIDLRLGIKATALDIESQQLMLDGDRLSYTALVIATGATARRLPQSSHLAGVHTLRTLDDARAIRSALETCPRHVVVVGAGFIGSEIAATIRQRGLPVTIVEAAPVPLVRSIGEQMGAFCARIHDRHGTTLLCGLGIDAIVGDDRVRAVRLTNGTKLNADLLIVGVGAEPATAWLADSGLTLDDGIVCDETLHATVPGIYAAGDVVRWTNPTFGQQMRLEHWTTAAEQGAAAARNALRPAHATRYETVPYFWSDWYNNRLQFVGLPAADEVRVVRDDSDTDTFLALYRRGHRVTGALGINQRKLIMKLRSMIGSRGTWADSLELVRQT